jgi:ketosteroid isomerase-like protein
MATTKTMIEQAYTAFNKRDIDGALALMTQDVSWRNIAETAEVDGFLEGSAERCRHC